MHFINTVSSLSFLVCVMLIPACSSTDDDDSKSGDSNADGSGQFDAPLCPSRGYKIVGEVNGVKQDFSGTEIYNGGIDAFGPYVRFAVGPTLAGELSFDPPLPWKAGKQQAITEGRYTAQNGYVAKFDEGLLLWGPQETNVIETPGSVRFNLTDATDPDVPATISGCLKMSNY